MWGKFQKQAYRSLKLGQLIHNRIRGIIHAYVGPKRDVVELLLIGAISLVVAAYHLTHTYPAWSGGLYLETATQISANGYGLPHTIPGYTDGGIPFGYPPLGYYIITIILDLGVAPRTVALWLPSIALASGAVGVTFLGETISGSRRVGLVSAIVYLTSPGLLRGTITAMGMIRGPAMVVSTFALAVGIRVFRRELNTRPFSNAEPQSKRVLLGTAIVLFATVAALHPEYAAFAGISYVLFWLWFDHSMGGLLHGVAVAAGGALLTAPWWITAISRHGIEVFTSAGSTHGGIVQLTWPVALLNPPPTPLLPLWPAFITLSAIILITRREWFLPVWMVGIGFLMGREDHLLLVGAVMTGTVTVRHALPGIRSLAMHSNVKQYGIRREAWGQLAVAFVLLVFVTYSIGTAGVFVAGLPTFADGEDKAMMESLEAGSEVVVIGDAGEWLGYYGNVTHTTALRGTEWTGQFRDRVKLRDQLTHCLSASCITETLLSHNITAEYLYIALDGYSNSYPQALMDLRREYLVDSVRGSDDYDIRNESENVVIGTVRNESLSPGTGAV